MGFWDMATMSYKGVPTELGNKIVNDGNSVLDMRFNPVKEIYEVQVKSDDGILVDGYNVFQDGDYEQMAQYADASVTDVLMPVSNGAMIAGVMSGVFGLAFIIALWCIQGTPKGCKSKRPRRSKHLCSGKPFQYWCSTSCGTSCKCDISLHDNLRGIQFLLQKVHTKYNS